MHCGNCSNLCYENSNFCPKCGEELNDKYLNNEPRTDFNTSTSNSSKEAENWVYPRSDSKKSPIFAAVLSFLFPGLGQIYNGQLAWGLMLMALLIFVGIFITAGTGYFIGMFLTAFWAYNDAKTLNIGKPIHKRLKFGATPPS